MHSLIFAVPPFLRFFQQPRGKRIDCPRRCARISEISLRSGSGAGYSCGTFRGSKSKYGMTSILSIITASHIVNISGYFSGLSCPSGTDSIIAFFTAPVSNSAGQTRLPTFSSIARSISSAPSPASPDASCPHQDGTYRRYAAVSPSRRSLRSADGARVDIGVDIRLHYADPKLYPSASL